MWEGWGEGEVCRGWAGAAVGWGGGAMKKITTQTRSSQNMSWHVARELKGFFDPPCRRQ